MSILIYCSESWAKPAKNAAPPPPPTDSNAIDEDPFMDYSDFQNDPQQEMDERFFHYGRFFSLTLLAGHTNWTSNLGGLYYSAPLNTIGGKFTYFFDLNWAMDMGYLSSKHSFSIISSSSIDNIGQVDVRLARIFVNFKYYFDQRNLNAFLSFLNPHIGAGGGIYYRRQIFIDQEGVPVSDNAFGATPMVGFDIPIREQSVYLNLEAKYTFVNFQDESDDALSDVGFATLDGDPWEVLTGLSLSW